MKKDNQKDELRTEYKRSDLGKGERGKYYKAYKEGHNLVLLKPEVAKAFPSEKAVNEALKSLIEVAKNATGIASR
ncbi:MAG TPA: hypothetical protein ENL20_08060 [Candidatus Cloacimonetes bacterium]|nr:hypothetical protein [Candidatus Cloacimonadota bacterium]